MVERCPCCGGTDISYFNQEVGYYTDLSIFGSMENVAVKCKECGLQTDEYLSYVEAEDAWNKRVKIKTNCDRCDYRKKFWQNKRADNWISVDERNSITKQLIKNIQIDKQTGCWEWQGTKRNKYGSLTVGSRTNETRRTVMAHRMSYEIFKGNISEGLYVCHKCDNPLCINPDHLFIGTHQDNVDDREKKGRNNHVVGEKVGNAKLTDKIVNVCRIRHKHGESIRSIARHYGVDHHTMSNAIKGITWSHIPQPPHEENT